MSTVMSVRPDREREHFGREARGDRERAVDQTAREQVTILEMLNHGA